MGEKCWHAEETKAEKCFLPNSKGGVSRLFEILGNRRAEKGDGIASYEKDSSIKSKPGI